jgi:GTP-binding protein EngB required for normal cell division
VSRFVRAVQLYLSPEETLTVAAARQLTDRAGARLALDGAGTGRGHTVVALAGATGVGKSTLFNALARMALSPPGHLRPTTGEAHACVWDPRGADPLLDWLGVAPRHRFMRESLLDAEDEAPLRGLVLLDLPDMDSIATGNRVEADRLVGVVDRVIWVLDPQKYADQTVHEQYLRRMGALRDVTVVVFNQTDLLSRADADRCRADLVRLVDDDGLPGVPVIAVSARTGAGIDEVRALLEKVVADRHAATARLTAELDATVARLTPLAPVAGPADEQVSRDAVPELGEAFAAACGADALAAEAAWSYRQRAVLWRAPWHRAAVLPAIPPADPAAVGTSVRRLAHRLGDRLPESWQRHLRAAATAELDGLPSRLAGALAAGRGSSPVPPLWTALRNAWWLAIGGAVAGVLGGLSTQEVQPWLVVAVGCLAVVLALPALAVTTGAWRALRYRRAVARRMAHAALQVARDVVAPVRQILRDYAQAHAALGRARATSDEAPRHR